jgi:hypothetical protein
MGLSLFEEAVRLLTDLERRGIPYAVAGAVALAIHGVQMKAWAGREQDLADIVRLRELDR